MNEIEMLQEWYQKNCDGDWEHYTWVKIDCIDNPGWCVEIDTSETLQVLSDCSYVLEQEDDDDDWIAYEVKSAKFIGNSGPKRLVDVLKKFFELLEKSEKSVGITSKP